MALSLKNCFSISFYCSKRANAWTLSDAIDNKLFFKGKMGRVRFNPAIEMQHDGASQTKSASQRCKSAPDPGVSHCNGADV